MLDDLFWLCIVQFLLGAITGVAALLMIQLLRKWRTQRHLAQRVVPGEDDPLWLQEILDSL